MSNPRSLWNIERHKNGVIGMEMINHSGEYFFLHGEMLCRLYQNLGMLVMVKHRDRYPEKAISHHPGEIRGKMLEVRGEYYGVALFFGYGGEPIEYDPDTDKLMNVHFIRSFIFPKNDIESLVHIFGSLYVHQERFREMKLRSKMRCDVRM